MPKLSREDVLKLARLARLELSEEELDFYPSELNQILEYVEQLQNVDTNDIKATDQVTGLVNVMREDNVQEYGYTADTLLNNLPSMKEQLIKVNRMVE